MQVVGINHDPASVVLISDSFEEFINLIGISIRDNKPRLFYEGGTFYIGRIA